ncbi:MAG: enoyl-CoA hydratase/isomerase family protein [Magnetospirillum sp.]|nr:enoyl-CoA hydratase/isomerase family protein [Magnetospirillum sp.]
MLTITQEPGITILGLHRPESFNALCSPLVVQLETALDEAEADPGIRVIVLTGSNGHFAAGADLKEMLPLTVAQVMAADFSGCCHRLAEFGKPMVAAVEGLALGGGCELVEMCDIVIAADNASFGHPEIIVGSMPGAGGTQRLPRAMGKAKALDLLLTGRRMSAIEAESCGLVSRVVPAAELMTETMAVARHLAQLSPLRLRQIKEAVLRSFSMGLDQGLALERRLFHLTFATDDRREGMQAFVSRRKPVFGRD